MLFKHLSVQQWRSEGLPAGVNIGYAGSMANKKHIRQQKNIPRPGLGFLLLLLLAGGIIFPFGWLAQIWPSFGQAFDWLFHSEAAHISAHTLLFATIGFVALWLAPRLFSYWPVYLATILSLGLMQEALQYATFKHIFDFNALFDLGVDLSAAGLVFITVRWLGSFQQAQQPCMKQG